MFLLQKLWIKKHKKHLIFITLLLVLLTLILCSILHFFHTQEKMKWINKYIEAERRAEACLPMQPKIVKKNLI